MSIYASASAFPGRSQLRLQAGGFPAFNFPSQIQTVTPTIDCELCLRYNPMTSSNPEPGQRSQPASVTPWQAIVARYQNSSAKRGIWQLVNTLVPYAGLWCLMYLTSRISWWLTAPLAVLAGSAGGAQMDRGQPAFLSRDEIENLLVFIFFADRPGVPRGGTPKKQPVAIFHGFVRDRMGPCLLLRVRERSC